MDYGFDLMSGFGPMVSEVPMAPPSLSLPSFDFNMPNLTPAMTGLNVSSMVPETGLTNFGGMDWFDPTSGGGMGIGTTGSMTAPTIPGSGPGDGGGGGFMDTISRYAKPVSALLGGAASLAQIPLGIESLNIARKGQKALESGVQTAQRAAAPQIAAEEALLPAGTNALLTGQLPPQLQQQVDNQVNQAKQMMLQQMTRAGMDPATAEAMIEGQLQQLRNQLTMQAAQSLMGGGQDAAAGATSSASQGGQLGQNEFQNANQAVQGSQQALYRLLGAG